MAEQKTVWVAEDGVVFESEEDATLHEAQQAVFDDLSTNLDANWNNKIPITVLKWVLDNYDVSKKLKADTAPISGTVVANKATP